MNEQPTCRHAREVEKLTDQLARYRTALEKIARWDTAPEEACEIARAALKEEK